MRIRFVVRNNDMNRGSYRVWVDNFSQTLNSLGVQTNILKADEHNVRSPSNLDCVIYDKGITPPLPPHTHQSHGSQKAKTLIGAINPPANKKYDVDFVIVGSREEENSLSFYENIIFVPLIEVKIKIDNRIHTKGTSLCIGYHGNEEHLNSFESCGLTKALEQFKRFNESKSIETKLVVISPKHNPEWRSGRPKIDTEFHKYDWNNFCDLLNYIDIGIVPNSYYQKPRFLSKLSNINSLYGKYDTDYVMRFKNKTNHGRLLVFMRAKIPAIADLSPSHLALLGDDANGFLAANSAAWLRHLKVLSSPAMRQQVADNAFTFVCEKYDESQYAKRFIEQIKMIKARKPSIS